MSIKLTHLAGTDQALEVLSVLTGLVLQDPAGQTQRDDMGGTDLAGNVDAAQMKVSFGTPFVIECTIDTEETGGAATDVLSGLSGEPLDVFPKFDADIDNTGCPFKIKIIDMVCVVLDESAGSVADTILVQKLDSDGSTKSDITNAMSLNVADDLLVRPATLNQDACVIDVQENIRFDVVLANSSNHATSIKVYIFAMRCVADE